MRTFIFAVTERFSQRKTFHSFTFSHRFISRIQTHMFIIMLTHAPLRETTYKNMFLHRKALTKLFFKFVLRQRSSYNRFQIVIVHHYLNGTSLLKKTRKGKEMSCIVEADKGALAPTGACYLVVSVSKGLLLRKCIREQLALEHCGFSCQPCLRRLRPCPGCSRGCCSRASGA